MTKPAPSGRLPARRRLRSTVRFRWDDSSSSSRGLTYSPNGVPSFRLGNARDTRGTAFVVYEDIYDAKSAVDHLSGFNVGGRYLVVLYYQPAKFERRIDAEAKQKELEELRRQVKAKKAAIAAAEEGGDNNES